MKWTAVNLRLFIAVMRQLKVRNSPWLFFVAESDRHYSPSRIDG